jgi:tetrahydromethanopterin S-methyltransferase subunit G
LQGLDPSSRAALGLLFAHGGSLADSFVLSQDDRNTIERFGARPENIFPALEAMRESLVRVEADSDADSHRWVFAHPTIRDAFADLTAGTATYLRIYLAGADVGHIIREVYCGRLPEGSRARVVVPPDAYEALVSRLDAYVAGKAISANREVVQLFLATRCSEQFLSIVSKRAPTLFEPGQYGYYETAVDDPWLRLCERLAEVSLVAAHLREAAVLRMEEYSPSDLSFLESDTLREFFKPNEYEALQRRLQHKLEERLEEQIRLCVYDCEGLTAYYSGRIEDRILERFSSVLEYFEALNLELEDQPDLLEIVEDARQLAIAVEARLVGQNDEEFDDEAPVALERAASESGDRRDIFRDVADDPVKGDPAAHEPDDSTSADADVDDDDAEPEAWEGFE